MKIVDFAEFSRRRSAAPSSAVVGPGVVQAWPQVWTQAPQAWTQPPVTDRWAMLHTAPVEDAATSRDFWSDLQLRLAYPSYQYRHH